MKAKGLLAFALLCVGLLHGAHARADACRMREDRFAWYTPDYVEVQTGGHQGFLTLGAGYLWFDARLELGAHYGWVPPTVGGKSLHSLSFALVGRARGVCIGQRVNWSYLYGGVGLLLPLGSEGFFFTRVPERYRDGGYYRRTGLRSLYMVGTELQVLQRLPRGELVHGLFWEITAYDEYLTLWLRNRGTISFVEPFSSAFGYRLRF
jgi:hypothetical protein